MTRILLAEDNPADVYLLREALGADDNSEIELIVVSDGEEALDFVAGRFPGVRDVDLVILDLNLPKSDGGDVLRGIRESGVMAAVPVVILTSSDSPRDREAAERLGADCYLTKPSDLDEFLSLGSTLLSYAARGPCLARKTATLAH